VNFLNPLALLGLVAAGIPVLLHLLNLRRLKTVEFSTLRFLQELQQTRVRRLRIQQILLLILRTLLVIFAVLAFARPTIETRLPLLSSAERSSVVILVDNSASMEGADQKGRRFRQAQDAAQQVIERLADGDEVCVLPLAGRDPYRNVGFTRTFQQAAEEVERIKPSEDRADVPGTLASVSTLLKDAAHAYREIYVISDAQRSTLSRAVTDSGLTLDEPATIFLVRIGDGLQGLEQNLSVDSLQVVTALFQPSKPIEVEAFVRNGSDRDATGVAVSMAFDGVRVSQRAVDIPAGATRSVVLAAPPQRRGMIGVSIELDDDAIDGDNVRYAGVTIPPRARIAVVGSGIGSDLVRVALELSGSVDDPVNIQRYATVAELAPALERQDVVYVVGAEISSTHVDLLTQYVDRGGGLVLFASERADQTTLLARMGLDQGPVREAGETPWKITALDDAHPLYRGVFQTSGTSSVVESAPLTRQRSASGGAEIATTNAGPLISEGAIGSGRVIYVGVGLDGSWGPFAATGLFAATVVRASLYTSNSRDVGVESMIGEPVSAPVPGRYAGAPSFLVTDPSGVTTSLAPVRLPTATLLSLPAQRQAGVVRIATADSTAVMTISVNPPVQESMLTFLDDDAWEDGIAALVSAPDRVVVTEAGRSMDDAVRSARVGSELWPLFVVLAVLCALAESLVSRFMAQDETGSVSP